MSSLAPDQVLATPVGMLAEQSNESLFQLKNDAIDLLTTAKSLVEHIDQALSLKDTGIVHFDDGHVRITADLPKKIEWDQAMLVDITRRIASNGDDPSEYVEISYRVSEAKFNAWPDSIKSFFVPARTLKTGKPGFRLTLLKESTHV